MADHSEKNSNSTLTCTLNDTHIKAEESSVLVITLRNVGSDHITFDNIEGKYNADNLPKLDDTSFPIDFGWIFISFSFGDKAENLTTVANSQHINLNLSESNRSALSNVWVIKADTSRKGRYFTLFPDVNESYSLAPGQFIVLTVNDIIANGITGKTPIDVDVFTGQPTSHKTTLYAEKLLKPHIKSFTSTADIFELDTDMTLQWTADHAENCLVTVDGNEVSAGATQYTTKVADKDFTLEIKDYFNRTDSKKYHPPIEYKLFLSLKSYDADMKTLMISWIARNAKDLYLDGTPITSATGDASRDNLEIPKTYEFTLNGKSKKDGQPLASCKLPFATFTVTSFTVSLSSQTNSLEHDFPQAETFVSPRKLRTLRTSRVAIGFYESPPGWPPEPYWPPTPPEPPSHLSVRASWNGVNVDHYTITHYSASINGSNDHLDYTVPRDATNITLTAYGKNGGCVTRSASIQS